MNTLPEPILQKSIKSFLHARHLRNERLVECEHGQSSNRLMSQEAPVQESAPEVKSPLIKRRPIPPAKPPMRFARA